MTQEEAQRAVCQQYQADYLASENEHLLGVSRSVREGSRPLHGLRHQPEDGTTGWYIWAGEVAPHVATHEAPARERGEWSDADDFFQPVHVAHIEDWAPRLERYLGLGPGWRFLLVPEEGYEDVWYDENIR